MRLSWTDILLEKSVDGSGFILSPGQTPLIRSPPELALVKTFRWCAELES